MHQKRRQEDHQPQLIGEPFSWGLTGQQEEEGSHPTPYTSRHSFDSRQRRKYEIDNPITTQSIGPKARWGWGVGSLHLTYRSIGGGRQATTASQSAEIHEERENMLFTPNHGRWPTKKHRVTAAPGVGGCLMTTKKGGQNGTDMFEEQDDKNNN
jgi:hypothetical protein